MDFFSERYRNWRGEQDEDDSYEQEAPPLTNTGKLKTYPSTQVNPCLGTMKLSQLVRSKMARIDNLKLVWKVACALHARHREGFVVVDVSPKSISLSPNADKVISRVTVTDVGFSTRIGENFPDFGVPQVLRSEWHCACVYVQGKAQTACDIYALGCFLEAWLLKVPFPDVMNSWPENMRKLVHRMKSPRHMERPILKEVVEAFDSFIKDLEIQDANDIDHLGEIEVPLNENSEAILAQRPFRSNVKAEAWEADAFLDARFESNFLCESRAKSLTSAEEIFALLRCHRVIPPLKGFRKKSEKRSPVRRLEREVIDELRSADPPLIGRNDLHDIFRVEWEQQVVALKIHKRDRFLRLEYSSLRSIDGAGGAPRVLASCAKEKALLTTQQEGMWMTEILPLQLDPITVVNMALKVTRALVDVHKKGFIHGNLQEKSIMVESCSYWEVGEVHLVDWDLSRKMGKEYPDDIPRDDVHCPCVYRRWLAKASCDVYSLGRLMMFWSYMLTGQRLWRVRSHLENLAGWMQQEQHNERVHLDEMHLELGRSIDMLERLRPAASNIPWAEFEEAEDERERQKGLSEGNEKDKVHWAGSVKNSLEKNGQDKQRKGKTQKRKIEKEEVGVGSESSCKRKTMKEGSD